MNKVPAFSRADATKEQANFRSLLTRIIQRGAPTPEEQRAAVDDTPVFCANFRAANTPLFPKGRNDPGRFNTGRVAPDRDQDLGICFNTLCTESDCEHGEQCPWLYLLSEAQLRWMRKTNISFQLLRTIV